MAKKTEVVEKLAIDWYIAQRVKERRKVLKISQADLSFQLGNARSYVSNVESKSNSKHYTTEVINQIAKILKCSPRDFWPDEPL